MATQFRKNRIPFLLSAILIAVHFLVYAVLPAALARAAFTPEINYQGRLLDSSGNAVADDTYNIQFKLYDAASSGTLLWTETHCYSPDSGATCNGTGTDGRIETNNGLFSVMLGSVNSLSSLDFNQPLYLSVNIGGTGTTPSYDGEMSPRKALGAVPAAFVADTLDGLDSSAFFREGLVNATSSATTSLAIVQNGAGKIAEFFGPSYTSVLSILSGGNVGVGTSTPDYAFQVHRNATQTDLAVTTNTNVGSGNTTSLQFISDNDGTPNAAIIGQFNDGSLRLSGSNSLVTPGMVITDDNFVGIGTTSPYAKLSVVGQVVGQYFTATSTTSTSTFPRIDVSDLDISGKLYDSTASAGTNGYVLQTTSTGVEWVATSTLGISGGSSLWTQSGSDIYYTTGNVGIGTTTPGTLFSIGNTTGVNFTADGGIFVKTPSNIYTPIFKIVDDRGDEFSYIGAQNSVNFTVKTGPSDGNASWVGNFGKGDGVGTLALNFNAGATTVGTIGIDAANDFYLSGGSATDFNFSVGNSSNFNITTGASSNISAIAGNASGSGNLSLLGTSASTNNRAGITTSAGDSLALITASSTRLTVTSDGFVGIGTTSPYAKLSVVGQIVGQYFTATSTTATSTFPRIDVSDLDISGKLYDSTASAGTNGYVLQTTSTGVEWVATSTLGIATGMLDYGIGDAVTSGTLGSVLFVDASGNLAQDNASFRFANGQLFLLDAYNSVVVGDSTFSGDPLANSSVFGMNNTITAPTGNTFTTVVGNSNDVQYAYNTTVVGSLNTVGATYDLTSLFGISNTAAGRFASAFGHANSAYYYGTALGASNAASGNFATAIGYSNAASGAYGTTLGYINTASGQSSTAVGFRVRATANGASVFGGGGTGVGTSMTNNTANSTLIGPGATTSIHILGTGEVKLPYLTATSTTATSTFPRIDVTDLDISGKLYDSNASAGTNGYVLQTTSTGVEWVATSTLGIATSPAGSNTQIQFNNSGSFGSSADFAFSTSAGLIGNESGGTAVDLRWETDTLPYGFFVDASANQVFVGYSSAPSAGSSKLDVNGTIQSNGMFSPTTLDYGFDLTTTSFQVYDSTASTNANITSDLIYILDGSDSIYLRPNYINFSSTGGASGFGIRNNGGVLEYKNSGGTWVSFDSLTSAPSVEVGTVMAYATSSLPDGWLWADGSAVSRTTYAELFATIGTTFGVGDGSTTFNLPDLRGRTIAGKDNMDNTVGSGGGDAGRLTSGSKAGIDGDTLGASGGVEEHLLTAQESGLRSHIHDVGHSTASNTQGGGSATRVTSVGNTTVPITVYDTGWNAVEEHTNVQPTLVLNYIIKYEALGSGVTTFSRNGDTLYFTDGSVGIGTTTPSGLLALGQSTDAASGGLWIAATDGDYRSIYMDTSQVLNFNGGSGNTATLSAVGSWTNASDAAYKENVEQLDYGLEEIMQLNPRRYTWKANGASDIGFIAQELEQIIPEVVFGQDGSKTVSYGQLTSLAISGLQDFGMRIDVLEAPTSTPALKLSADGRVIVNDGFTVANDASIGSLTVEHTATFANGLIVTGTSSASFGGGLLVEGNVSLGAGDVTLTGTGIDAANGFAINGSQFAITQEGFVGIGTSTPSRVMHVVRDGEGSPVRFQDANGYCEINPTTASLVCTSDQTLKENITELTSVSVLEQLRALKPVTFEWMSDNTDTKRVGFIAQEVEVVIPELVHTDDETGLKSVAYGGFVPYIISALKELATKLDVLTEQVGTLAEQMELLASRGYSATVGAFQRLTVGSEAAPAGITIYDEETGNPYCFTVRNGSIVTRLGACGTPIEEVTQTHEFHVLEEGNSEGNGTSTVPAGGDISPSDLLEIETPSEPTHSSSGPLTDAVVEEQPVAESGTATDSEGATSTVADPEPAPAVSESEPEAAPEVAPAPAPTPAPAPEPVPAAPEPSTAPEPSP